MFRLLILFSTLCGLLQIPHPLQAAQNEPERCTNTVIVAVAPHIVSTGIAEVLGQSFHADTGISVTWVPKLKDDIKEFAARCEADVLIMNRPVTEEELMEAGITQDWRPLMYNKLLLVGDRNLLPLMTRQSVIASLNTVVKKKISFIGRGENSDNMNAEQFYWQLMKITPYESSWYLKLQKPSDLNAMALATEKHGATIVSQFSWDAYKQKYGVTNSPLTVLCDDDPLLLIQHNLMTISKKFCPSANYDKAKIFVDWMTSQKAQDMIRGFSYKEEDAFSPALAY